MMSRSPWNRRPILPARPLALRAALLLIAGTLFACGAETPTDQEAGSSAAAADTAPAELSPAMRLARLDQGKKLYLAECSGCHGERGRADGPANKEMVPQPRNFARERFRYRSTPSGQPPRRDDIVETITRGMPGSAMPGFGFLSEQERTLIAEYVLYLANLDPAAPPPAPYVLAPEPRETAGAIARGKQVYVKLGCDKCHGAKGSGDGPSAATTVDGIGRPLPPRDLRQPLRRGATTAEVVRTLHTGLDGAAMPSYTGTVGEEELWDLARFVRSLQRPPPPLPGDLLARGRHVIEQRQCNACHTIDGKGGVVGPSLDVSAQKLRQDWVQEFLADPRRFGKIYPFTPYRMPDLGLEPAEVEGVLAVFGEISGRGYPEPAETVPAHSTALADQGKLYYFLKCTECHNLGEVIPTPLAKQQGPDLVNISRRLRYDWIPAWVEKPQAVYPGTAMIDTNLSAEEIEAVRGFLWRVSSEQLARDPSSAPADARPAGR
jgi:mono/diheme cytochrome c family protein